MLKVLLTKAFLAKATAVIAGLGLATTGAGAADVLPQVAQDRVAAAVEKVTSLDLPDSGDAADSVEKAEDTPDADEVDTTGKPEDAGKPDDAGKPEQVKDNFGSIVSERARTTEDKGREFGQTVSAEARARAEARHEAKPADDGSDDQDEAEAEADEQETPEREHHGRPETPGAQGNRGSGGRR